MLQKSQKKQNNKGEVPKTYKQLQELEVVIANEDFGIGY